MITTAHFLRSTNLQKGKSMLLQNSITRRTYLQVSLSLGSLAPLEYSSLSISLRGCTVQTNRCHRHRKWIGIYVFSELNIRELIDLFLARNRLAKIQSSSDTFPFNKAASFPGFKVFCPNLVYGQTRLSGRGIRSAERGH